MQHPLLTGHNGGKAIDPHAADEQERRACAAVADGCEKALTFLAPLHPRRDEYLAMLADFRLAAGPHCAQSLVLAG